MINKKLIYLFVGYISGNIIASLYGNKTSAEIRENMEVAKQKGDMEDKKVLLDYLLDMHKKIYSDLSYGAEGNIPKNIVTKIEAFKDSFKTSKKELLDIISPYKNIDTKNIDELGEKIQTFFSEKFQQYIGGKTDSSKETVFTMKKTKKTPIKKKIVSKKM